MKWISVDDKMPDDDLLKVVAYSEFWKGKIGSHIGITVSRYYLPSNQVDKKSWCFEFGNTQHTKITHWCSIPDTGIIKRTTETF